MAFEAFHVYCTAWTGVGPTISKRALYICILTGPLKPRISVPPKDKLSGTTHIQLSM